MIISIRVVPKSSRALIKEEDSGLKVFLTKPAQDGLANRQLIELLAEHFSVKRYRIKIIKGEKSKNKLVEIED